MQSGGYDKEEVNALLAQIVESYQAVYDENKELYRKMEILAGKIEEYRNEEDSIKTALITAPKDGGSHCQGRQGKGGGEA